MNRKIEGLADAELDNVAGGNGNHKKWIDVLSVSQGTTRARGEAVPVEDFSLNFEEIKVT